MFSLLFLWIGSLICLFRSRGNLVLENLVLRQQLAVHRSRAHPAVGIGTFSCTYPEVALNLQVFNSRQVEQGVLQQPFQCGVWHRYHYPLHSKVPGVEWHQHQRSHSLHSYEDHRRSVLGMEAAQTMEASRIEVYARKLAGR